MASDAYLTLFIPNPRPLAPSADLPSRQAPSPTLAARAPAVGARLRPPEWATLLLLHQLATIPAVDHTEGSPYLGFLPWPCSTSGSLDRRSPPPPRAGIASLGSLRPAYAGTGRDQGSCWPARRCCFVPAAPPPSGLRRTLAVAPELPRPSLPREPEAKCTCATSASPNAAAPPTAAGRREPRSSSVGRTRLPPALLPPDAPVGRAGARLSINCAARASLPVAAAAFRRRPTRTPAFFRRLHLLADVAPVARPLLASHSFTLPVQKERDREAQVGKELPTSSNQAKLIRIEYNVLSHLRKVPRLLSVYDALRTQRSVDLCSPKS
ncbi:uncharacterized protein LOC109722153 [Ananas comosus]|uniref:Uncharacterized protein LOC109722153 n=1 Tax=Ananas comosus TaxID=4615 RepID=A0A6P5GAN0_ANACO|nr:uncharacterized protein LOC109722153 [Ananas comosus]